MSAELRKLERPVERLPLRSISQARRDRALDTAWQRWFSRFDEAELAAILTRSNADEIRQRDEAAL